MITAPARPGWKPRREGDFPSLGWGILQWTYEFLPSPANELDPFVFTDEQARRLLRMYELDPETGGRLYRRTHMEEAKGWGKSPIAGAVALAEYCGPVCFDGWDANGQPVGVRWGTGDRPVPWIQIAAVSEDQTENTYLAIYDLLTMDEHRAALELGIDEGRTRLYLRDQPAAFLERATASAGSREGQRLTFAVLDEPQLWLPANGGPRLARTILRNLAKTGGAALFTGNAPVMGEDSVAEIYGNPVEGALHFGNRPRQTPELGWTNEQLMASLKEVYGDAYWIDLDRIIAEIRDRAQPWEDSKRFFFNLRGTGVAERWMPEEVWNACEGDPVFQQELPVYSAVVVEHDHRAAALALAQRQGDYVMLRVSHYADHSLGPGDYLDLAGVELDALATHRRYPAEVMGLRPRARGNERPYPMKGPLLAYHGSFFQRSAQFLREQGMATIDVPATQERYSAAAGALMNLALERRIVHDGDPVLAFQMAHITGREASRGWMIDAPAGARTAGVRAAMIAVQQAMNAKRPPSRTIRRGFR